MIKRILLRVLMVLGIVILVLVLNLVFFTITANRVSEGAPITDPNMENVALLVIDIQGGTTGTTSAIKPLIAQSEQLISRVNPIIQDAYDRGQLIVYIRTEVVNPLLNVLNNTMARGTEGAELDQRLLILPGPVVVKRKSDSFLGTDLDQILGDHQIGKIVVVGLDAAGCVKKTLLAAHNRGYEISLVEEAVISAKEEDKAEAFDELRELGVEFLSMN